MFLFSLRVYKLMWTSAHSTGTHQHTLMSALSLCFQGNLVNFLRTRGRSLIPEQQLKRFALWVDLPISKLKFNVIATPLTV